MDNDGPDTNGAQDAQDRGAPDWRDITDPRVLRAMETVPRAEFVPRRFRQLAARDAPLPIGCDQTISQPYVVALMTQALALEPGESVLEIGTGSGYQTAILCELTHVLGRPKGETVFSLERHARLARRAEASLVKLGYAPHVTWGDGARGWPQDREFDAMMVTAAPKALPRPLWQQLADGGRMIIPIGATADEQTLWLLRKQGDTLARTPLGAVRFVPLVSDLLDDPNQIVAFA